MKMNFNTIMFTTVMMVSLMMATSSNNWIMIWCSLEIMLISFIPITISNKLTNSESTMQYFIVQSISSSLLMMGVMLMVMSGDYNYLYVINSSLLIKMGVSPFHNWVLTVIEGLDLNSMLILLTIIKIAPIMLMSYMTMSMLLILIMTMVTGGLLGLNQNSMKKIIGYSSIFNMAMIMTLIKNNFMWITYLILYSTMMLMLILMMKQKKIKFINQMIINEESILTKMNLWVIMLSMGGMPPLLGFSIKFMVMQMAINNKNMMFLSVMILMSLIIMFFYLRMTFLSIMNFTMQMKSDLFKIKQKTMMTLIMNLSLLPMMLTMKVLT